MRSYGLSKSDPRVTVVSNLDSAMITDTSMNYKQLSPDFFLSLSL